MIRWTVEEVAEAFLAWGDLVTKAKRTSRFHAVSHRLPPLPHLPLVHDPTTHESGPPTDPRRSVRDERLGHIHHHWRDRPQLQTSLDALCGQSEGVQMVEKDHDHHRVVMAQEDSEEQVQGVLVYILSERVHLLARFFTCAAERVFEQQ